jgi:hypothetical protein
LETLASVVVTEVPDPKRTCHVTDGLLINEKTYDKRMNYGMATGSWIYLPFFVGITQTQRLYVRGLASKGSVELSGLVPKVCIWRADVGRQTLVTLVLVASIALFCMEHVSPKPSNLPFGAIRQLLR